MANRYFAAKSFSVVTGASRGIGRQIALDLARTVRPDSTILLTARNNDALQLVRDEMRLLAPNLKIRLAPLDMTTAEGPDFHAAIREALGEAEKASFQAAMIFHNHCVSFPGQYSPIHADLDLQSVDQLQTFFHGNLSSVASLNSVFFEHFKVVATRLVVYVTSNNSYDVTLHCGLYSMCKAGCNMFFRCVSLADPGARVMLFDPGVVKTDLFEAGFADGIYDERLKAILNEDFILSPEQSVAKLFEALVEDKFVNGTFVNVSDDPAEYFGRFRQSIADFGFA